MSESTSRGIRYCPYCDADIPSPAAQNCWLCGELIPAESQFAGPAKPPREHRPIQFELDSLFFLMTLICVWLGVTMIAPGLGFIMALLLVPATIRALSLGERRRNRGENLTSLDKIAVFGSSFMMIFVVATVSLVAFGIAIGTTCLGMIALDSKMRMGEAGISIMIVIDLCGLVVAAVAGIWAGVIVWKKYPRNKD